jgi:uncharacterized protein (DUF362 family)
MMKDLITLFSNLARRPISRRQFLKCFSILGLSFLFSSRLTGNLFANQKPSEGRRKKEITPAHHLVAVKGKDPFQNTVKAIQELGGMSLFVKEGDTVVVKPNIAWDRTPEQAANTNPSVVAAIVELCYKAKAKRVNVFDIPCNNGKRCYKNSGIREAAKAKGAYVYFADEWNVSTARFPYPSGIESWPILRDAIECDCFINVPVLKHHRLTGLTLSMKNLMGVCAGMRGLIHNNIGEKLVDLTDFINPELTIIDGTRVLLKNGPSGGSLDDVKVFDTVIASTDPTLADTYACGIVEKDPMDIPYIEAAARRGFGHHDLSTRDVLRIEL